jgi:hypothetical protein
VMYVIDVTATPEPLIRRAVPSTPPRRISLGGVTWWVTARTVRAGRR